MEDFLFISGLLRRLAMTEQLHRHLLWDSCDSIEECIKLILQHLFSLQKLLCDLLVEIFIARDDLLRQSIGIEEESTDLGVDEVLGLI
jgi:hypothetical protein